jgi:beta-alanine degradation protein BauB
MSTARGITNLDDDRVRVTTWTFQDGEATGHHHHEFDYVIVPVTGGTFDVLDSDTGARTLSQEAATPYLGRAGTSHDVINRSGRAAIFVEVELKQPLSS